MNKLLFENTDQQEIHLLYAEHGAYRLPWPRPAEHGSGNGSSPRMPHNQPLHVEPFRNRNGQARVLAVFSPGMDPTVNGEPAPRMFVLVPGDVVHWVCDEGGFRVALFNRPEIGSPPDSLVGKQCPVCRVPLQKGSLCLRCACGAAMHCEPEGKDSLQCAQLLGACPVCNRALTTKEGYVEEAAD